MTTSNDPQLDPSLDSEHNRRLAETEDYDGLTFEVIEEEVTDGSSLSVEACILPPIHHHHSLLSGFFPS